jgi:hypothetical protein
MDLVRVWLSSQIQVLTVPAGSRVQVDNTTCPLLCIRFFVLIRIVHCLEILVCLGVHVLFLGLALGFIEAFFSLANLNRAGTPPTPLRTAAASYVLAPV